MKLDTLDFLEEQERKMIEGEFEKFIKKFEEQVERRKNLKKEKITLQDILEFNLNDNNKTLNLYQTGCSNEKKTVHSLGVIKNLCKIDHFNKFKNDMNLNSERVKYYLADVYFQIKNE